MGLWGKLPNRGVAVLRVLPQLCLAVAVVALTLTHFALFAPPFATTTSVSDEGYINAIASRLRSGHMLPYVDGVSHRGPMLYWVAAVATAFGGDTSFGAMRWLALGVGITNVLLVFAAAHPVKQPLIGGLAALVTTFHLIHLAQGEGLTYNGEILANVFGLAAFLCLAHALRPDSSALSLPWIAGAGGLLAGAVLSKQSALILALPFCSWVLLASLSRAERRWLPSILFAAGATLPIVVVGLRYLFSGALGEFVYYFATYNSSVYMAPITWSLVGYAKWLHPLWLWIVPYVLFGAWLCWRKLRGISSLAELDQRGFVLCVVMATLVSTLVSDVTLRHFPHYWVAIIPWLSLMAATFLAELIDRTSRSSKRRVFLYALACVFAIVVVGNQVHTQRSALAQSRLLRPSACDVIEHLSDPGDRIFVWGFAPNLYTFCKRQPASRFVFTTFLAGVVPWIPATPAEEQARVVPGSRQLVIADLEQSRARLIVDAPDSMLGHSITRIPELNAYLAAHYQLRRRADGYLFYVRNSDN